MNMTYVNLINANLLKKQNCRSITGTIWKQKNTIWTTQVNILNWMDVNQSSIVLEFKFLNITAMKNLNSFSYTSILRLAFASSWNHSLRTSIHLSILDLKKAFIYSSIPYVKPFVLGPASWNVVHCLFLLLM